MCAHFNHKFFSLILLLLISDFVMAQTDSTKKSDSALLEEVTKEMQGNSTQPQTTSAPVRGGLSFNPDISVIGDFQGMYNSFGPRNVDLYLNEAEISFQAAIDPYARADFFFSYERDPVTHAYSFGVEEGYLTSLSLPKGLQLKAGRFRMDFGRLNQVHPHARPFIDQPDVYNNYFGDGLIDDGFSLSYIIPNNAFYQELTVQVTGGPTDEPVFVRDDFGNHLIELAHLRNFWDLSSNTTLELGLTGTWGPNITTKTTTFVGGDLTIKHKPVQYNTYKSLTWQTEFIYCHNPIEQDEDSTIGHENTWGLYSYVDYQIAARWFLTGRFDYAENPTNASQSNEAYSLTAGWYATEFQKIEIEGKYSDYNYQKDGFTAWLRWIIVIGAHGAHQY